MIMSFRIKGLPAKYFSHLFTLPDEELAKHQAVRRIVDDRQPRYPCRVSLADSKPGDEIWASLAARGLHAGACRVAVCAHWIHSDGHAPAAVETWPCMTFEADLPPGPVRVTGGLCRFHLLLQVSPIASR
jgi:hypothetical protein